MNKGQVSTRRSYELIKVFFVLFRKFALPFTDISTRVYKRGSSNNDKTWISSSFVVPDLKTEV